MFVQGIPVEAVREGRVIGALDPDGRQLAGCLHPTPNAAKSREEIDQRCVARTLRAVHLHRIRKGPGGQGA